MKKLVSEHHKYWHDVRQYYKNTERAKFAAQKRLEIDFLEKLN